MERAIQAIPLPLRRPRLTRTRPNPPLRTNAIRQTNELGGLRVRNGRPVIDRNGEAMPRRDVNLVRRVNAQRPPQPQPPLQVDGDDARGPPADRPPAPAAVLDTPAARARSARAENPPRRTLDITQAPPVRDPQTLTRPQRRGMVTNTPPSAPKFGDYRPTVFTPPSQPSKQPTLSLAPVRVLQARNLLPSW